MKKLLIATLVLLMSATVFAQTSPKNEISVSYGIGSAADLNAFVKGFFVYILGDEEQANSISGTGSIAAEYYRKVSPLVSVGGAFVFNRITSVEEGVSSHKNYYSLMPGVKFNWYQRDWFGAYSKLNVGARLITSPDASQVKFAAQASLLGLEVGKRLRFFGEAGIGDQGVVLAGLRYRF